MPTQILAPGVGLDTSDEITVVAGAPVNVGLYRADGKNIERTCRGNIYRKDPDGVFNPTSYALYPDEPNLILVGAGVYHVVRVGAFLVPTGIQVD